VLFPAGLLVVLVLGAISVDLSARFLAQREAIAAAEAAANDAVGAAVDREALDGTGPLVLDPPAARRVALASLDAQGVLGPGVPPPVIEVVDPTTVRVTVAVRPEAIFLPVLEPGGPDVVTVSATAHLVTR
jgi:hypothetical protein